MDAESLLDYLDLDAALTPEERALRARVRRFVDEEVLPELRGHHRDATPFPPEFMRRMGELGLFAPHLPGYGCPGLGNTAYGLVSQELERGDSGIRSLASVQGALAMHAIHTFGSEAQKKRWLPALAKGEKLACFALTEPAHGSNPAGMETAAVRDGADYLLNGEKKWIGNGSVADVKVVWARDEAGHIGGFLVEPTAPGFSATDIEGKFSLRVSRTSHLFFRDCRIPADNRLPGAQGLKAALNCLSQARFGIAWGVIGAAIDCYTTALAYAQGREQFGRPIAAFQLVQEKLVFMLSEITKAQLIAFQLARLKDRGALRPQQISLAKRNNVWMALECARKSRDVLGAAGITDAYPIMRHLMNLETVYTYEGTHDIHTLVLGQDITGLGAFS